MLRFIDQEQIQNKTVLLRVDFDVALNPDGTIANDSRIECNLPTIKHLLENHAQFEDNKEQVKRLQNLLKRKLIEVESQKPLL